MPFEKKAGLTGKVYVPPLAAGRKHHCPDCFSCQICSDDRCTVCRGEKAHRPRQRADSARAEEGSCKCRVL